MTSPLLYAQYDPTNTYLASAIVELDSHKIRVQSINAAQSSLNTAFKLSSKLTLMSWGFLSGSRESIENEFIALGLSSGTIQIYSPFSNEVLAELVTPANLSITDFHYSKATSTGWSCDIGGNIHEWDLSTFSLVQTFSINDFLVENSEPISKISTVKYEQVPHLLVATHSVYLVNITERQVVKTFPAHIQPVNTLQPIQSNPDLFFTSAINDRFINLYSISKVATTLIFVTEAPVISVAFGGNGGDHTVLSAITEDGKVEVFNDPLVEQASTTSTPSRKKRRQAQSRTSDGTLQITRPAKEARATDNLNVTAITVSGETIVLTWLENASLPYFEVVHWLDSSKGLCITSNKSIEKSKPDFTSTVHSQYGHDVAATKHYNEGNAIVSDGSNLRDLQKDSDEEDDEEEEESLAEKLDKLSTEQAQKSKKSTERKKFGVGSNVTATLTIILSQALKNNDHSLLETVLSNRDPTVIQNTISKLDSGLAVVLLDRLAERIARQTSRFDQLNFWLKWIIIIHGGILTSLPNLNSKLSNLHAILLKKADVLPRLLELQGRLNLLYQQTELKREIIEDDVDQEEEESDVEYIEELEDAQFNGDISDDDMDMHDDYEDSDMEGEDEEDNEDDEEEDEDEEEEEFDGKTANALELEVPEDEEGYSDVEIEVQNDLLDDEEEEEEKAADLKVKAHIKNLKKRK